MDYEEDPAYKFHMKISIAILSIGFIFHQIGKMMFVGKQLLYGGSDLGFFIGMLQDIGLCVLITIMVGILQGRWKSENGRHLILLPDLLGLYFLINGFYRIWFIVSSYRWGYWF